LNKGLEQLSFLEEQVVSLLDKYRELNERNRELEELLDSRQGRLRQLEEMLSDKDALLAEVEGRIDRLLQKFSGVNQPVPDTPLLPPDESC
jgi:chromosome segregation ATPase